MKNFEQPKLPFATLIIVFVSALIIQSCSKDGQHIPNPFKEDKLLLSKVSGTVTSQDPNFYLWAFNIEYTYLWNSTASTFGPNSGNFQINYTYGKNKNGWDDIKSMANETFLNNGKYHFFYNNLMPDKVADSSIPGSDLGYWKFYFNDKEQVQKVGLGFSQTADPSQFELYNYDNRNRLDSFLYENAPDSSAPFMKVVYQYDYDNNITEFRIYAPFASSNASTLQDYMINGDEAAKDAVSIRKRNEAISEKVSRQSLLSLKNGRSQVYSALSANSNILFDYVLYLTAKVTTDGKTNPFSQQRHILFYQTNREYSFYDPTPFFLSLLKSNPVRIEYSVPSWGPDIAVQTFSYNYNFNGYPISVHEDFTDPDFAFLGNYDRDSQIEYIKNDDVK